MQKLLPTYFFAALSLCMAACSNNEPDESPSVTSAIPISTTVSSATDTTKLQRNSTLEIIPVEQFDDEEYVSIMPEPDLPRNCIVQEDIEPPLTLHAILNENAPKPQKYSVNSSSEKKIKCLQGTEISIPENVFTANGTDVYEGELTFAVTEYYSMADILMAKLHTLADSGILESGGMVYLEAYAGDKKLELLPGKTIGIKFVEAKEGMGIFYLKETDSNSVWYADNNTTISDVQVDEQTSMFEGGNIAYYNYLNSKVRYPDLNKNPTLTGMVLISCLIDTNGMVTNPAIQKSLHPAYDSIALKAVAEMPNWNPAIRNGKATPSEVVLPIAFDATDMALVENTKSDKKFKRKNKVDITDEMYQGIYTPGDSIVQIRNTIVELTTNASGLQIYENKVMTTAGLGYVNCDRYINNGVPNTNVLVDLPKGGETQLSLIVNDAKIVIPGIVLQQGGGKIYGVDKNLECTIFVIRMDAGQLSYCLQPIVTGSSKPIEVVLTDIAPGQFGDLVEKINAGQNLTVR